MQSIAIKKMALRNCILSLPDREIDAVEKFMKNLLVHRSIKNNRPISLEGIWKNKGFENLQNLDSEIEKIRAEIGNSILSRGL